MPKYRANVGLNYPDPKQPGVEIRVEAGDLAEGIPATSLPWLLTQGLVSEVLDDPPVDAPPPASPDGEEA